MPFKTIRVPSALVTLLLLASVTSVAFAATDSPPSLRVGIKEAPPLIIRGGDGQWHGPAVTLWERIAETNQLEFAYEEYDLEGLLAAVESGEIDVAVGALSMLPEREERLDFSHPYFLSGLGIAVRRDHTTGWLGGVLRFVSGPFLHIVGALLIVLLASGLAVWLFERRRNPEMFGGPAHQGVGSGFWWAAVTMTTVGYGDKAPRTAGGRLVALFWMYTSLVIISGFTAAIASALTVGALDSPIQGPEDVRGMRVATVAGSSSVDWLAGKGISYSPAANVEEALELLRTKQTDAVIYDAPILDFYVRSDPSGSLIVVDRRFDFHWYAFALPPGSKVTEKLNREILEITAGEDWRKHILETIGREP
jgi:polar amino acid transport system substrate-binding protein